ncbi:transposase [Bacteroides sp. 214]|uniref:transposase n=1 Tax=Bacteroides sp. 214 TaxID=2302935 RepID=UPI0013CFC82C|nr:transposase [Bacteroides sp. 214]NDW13200.1 transposase [Bacteroides sp. 214]
MADKGRNKDLISRRDEALLRRYHYWTEVKRLRFDDALRILSLQEFFISEERIMTIIRSKCDLIADVAVRPVPKVRMPHVSAAQVRILEEQQRLQRLLEG